MKEILLFLDKKNRKPGIPLTLEEALDSLLNLPTKGQRRLSTLDESSASLDTPVFPRAQLQSTHIGNLGIYTHNSALMEECKMSPEEAEDLLKVITTFSLLMFVFGLNNIKKL